MPLGGRLYQTFTNVQVLKATDMPDQGPRRGISGFFSSRTQVVIKESLTDKKFCSKKEWELYHFELNKLSFDDFLLTWEREKKECTKSVPRPVIQQQCAYVLQNCIKSTQLTKYLSFFQAKIVTIWPFLCATVSLCYYCEKSTKRAKKTPFGLPSGGGDYHKYVLITYFHESWISIYSDAATG